MQQQSKFKISARLDGLYRTLSPTRFETTAVDTLTLGFDGIAGDLHGGVTRRSGGREPWYPRGTEIRNERQISLVSPDDLVAVAAAMGVPHIRPEWIGANLLVSGIRDFTLLPPRTTLFFASGVTLRIDGLNVPCRQSGRAIAAHYPGHEDLELRFVKTARYLRGLVGWVEKPGMIGVGETIQVHVPEHRIYRDAMS
jgi:hypothetical protein